MRRFWIALGVLFVLFVAAVIALNLWVHSYLRSAAFRQLVEAKTGQALHADASYQPFDWSGSSVYSQTLTAQGQSGFPLESLTAAEVRANVDWKAIFDGAWRVENVDIVKLDVAIRSPEKRAATEGQPGPTPPPAPPKKGWLPNRFQLDKLSAQQANISIGTMGRVDKTGLVIQPEGSGWVFDGTGGRLELAKQQPLDITRFRVRLQQGVVYLTDADVRLGKNGEVSASGEVGGPTGPFDMNLEWQAVDSADVLDATWKDRLSGTLSGKAHVLGRDGQAPLTTGSVQLVDGLLEGLPVQKQIAQFTRSPQFERMPLQTVSGDYTYDGATTIVKNFVAESSGLLRLEGDCTIGPRGEIAGRFRIGVTPQSLQWLPGSQEKVFVTSQGGYLWTNVTIGGTVENPTEDLSSRLAKAMGEQVIDTGINILQQAPSKASDAVDTAIDILKPLIP